MPHRDRFEWLEDPADFPYYRGQPVAISARQWLFLMLMVLLGYSALITPLPFSNELVAQLASTALFLLIPLAGLAWVTPKFWTALFRAVHVREVKLIFGFWILVVVLSVLAGYAVVTLYGATPNPIVASLARSSGAERALMFARTLPHLLGEEVLTMLPFLAVLSLLHPQAGVSRKRAIIAAWLVSTAVFAAAHLPTYNWNFVQCFLVIGTARAALTLAYIKTKNLWVSTGTHVLTDWVYLGLSLTLLDGMT